MERPSRISIDSRNRLHDEERAAIAYRDGYELHSWHGNTVPKDVIESPQSITRESIVDEENAEIRRVRVERFGIARYVKESMSQIVDSDEYGTLYRASMHNDEPLLLVRVLNSTVEPDGSRKEYFLRVPPDITTAREAVAWTFGLRAEEYKPVKES